MKALDDFIAQVLDREPECTAEDIADMVWLAWHLPAATKATVKRAPATDQKPPENLGLSLPELDKTGVQPSKPQLPPSPVSSPPSAPIVSGPDSQPAQQRVRVSAAPGLEQVLQVAGSLRPLRRLAPSRFDSVIDYEQTARRSADENIWVPVLRPKLDRALSLALVLDQASSMSLWRPLVRDLRRLLVERGNFRQCRLWSLHTDSDSKPMLTAGWQARTDQVSRDPREVLAPGGQLVIVVSDCIAPTWYRSDMLSTLLEPWGQHSHLVVFNPLGEYLWPRTRLGLATPVQLSAPFPAASNVNLRIHEFDLLETVAPTGLKLSVVELDPPKLQQWAKMVMAREGMTASGFILSGADVDLSPLPVPVGQDERPPEQILAAFWQVASPQARRLLSLLAMTPIPVNLPMLRLLRSAFLPQCRPTHEAEVLYSGLFQPVTKESSARPDPERILYELALPVRRLLLDAAPVYDMKRLWTYIEQQDHGLGDTFQAILADPGMVARSSGQDAAPFLNIPLEIARRIWPEKFIEEKYEHGSGLRDRPQHPPITLSELEGPTVPLPPALQTLWDIICAAERPIDLDLLPDTLAEIRQHSPRNLTEYRLNRIADWSQPRYELDKRFVQLTLLLDKGEDAQGPRWESSRQFQDLRDVLQETLDTPALVLLGPPGSGKSTLLRRLEWDLAVDALRDPTAEQARLSFFVPLNQYQPARPGGSLPEPRQWLAERWAQRFPGLPPVDDWLRTGRGILLLDALNEIPSKGREAIGLWKKFLLDMAQACPGSRLIFSCRSLDYSSPLSSKDLTVPHVRIESLSDAQVEHFLQVYSPHGATLWRHLKGTPQLDLYRTPIYLKMLVNQADAEGHIPEGRASLFTGFVRQALQRERRAENPHFQPDDLLTQRDCERLTQHRWKHAYDLPGRGVLIPKLTAWPIGCSNSASPPKPRRCASTTTRRWRCWSMPKRRTILKAGVDLGVLDMDVR